MTVVVKELLVGQGVAEKNGEATLVLIEIIQRLVAAIEDQEARLVAGGL